MDCGSRIIGDILIIFQQTQLFSLIGSRDKSKELDILDEFRRYYTIDIRAGPTLFI